MRILLVEDDAPSRYAFSKALALQDHCVTSVSNIADARRALFPQGPDVAILDLMVGSETTLDLAGLVCVVSPETEIIFVTGTGLFPYAELFHMQMSVAAVFRKPVDLHELVEFVSHVGMHPAPIIQEIEFGRTLQCV